MAAAAAIGLAVASAATAAVMAVATVATMDVAAAVATIAATGMMAAAAQKAAEENEMMMTADADPIFVRTPVLSSGPSSLTRALTAAARNLRTRAVTATGSNLWLWNMRKMISMMNNGQHAQHNVHIENVREFPHIFLSKNIKSNKSPSDFRFLFGVLRLYIILQKEISVYTFFHISL